LTADAIFEINGGDSFSDIYGVWRFIVGRFPLLSVVVLGLPFTMLPQTYGPFMGRPSRAVGRFFLHRATAIMTRDRRCEEIVRALIGRAPQFCPDVAFTLHAVAPAHVVTCPRGLELRNRRLLVGINVSGLLYMGGYTGRNMFALRSDYRELVDGLVQTLLATTSADLLLVPHVFGHEEREEEACRQIAELANQRYAGRVFQLAAMSERELKWVIGHTDVFVGSRMHACIAALSQYVPALGLAYSDKFLGVFESAGVGDAVVDLRHVGVDQVIRRTMTTIERREETRARLERQVPAIQRQIEETFRTIVSRRSALRNAV
jgi:polysaccharide pyruvyl transferase WcaK-like protein